MKYKATLNFVSSTLGLFSPYWEIGAIKLLALRIKAGGSKKLVGGTWESFEGTSA